jgi:gamma-glutamylaminecyclotransferase
MLSRSPRPIDLFVYGTLLRGQSNHHYLENSKFLGEDAIANACLIDLGEYPMLIPGTDRVEGEVYQIDAVTLASLDELEECPIVYYRELVTLLSDRATFVYWGRSLYAAGHPIITGGSWRRHCGNRKE